MTVLLLLLLSPSLAAPTEIEACVAAQDAGTYEAWIDYLERFPGGTCAGTPTAIDARDCKLARRQDDASAWRLYVKQHPGGLCIEHALDQLPQDEGGPAEPAVRPLQMLEQASLAEVQAPTVLGGLSEAAVTSVLEAARPELGACLDDARLLNPDLAGRVELRFQVLDQGLPAKVRVRSSTVEHSGVEACLVDVIGAQRFAAPRDKAVVTVGIALGD